MESVGVGRRPTIRCSGRLLAAAPLLGATELRSRSAALEYRCVKSQRHGAVVLIEQLEQTSGICQRAGRPSELARISRRCVEYRHTSRVALFRGHRDCSSGQLLPSIAMAILTSLGPTADACSEGPYRDKSAAIEEHSRIARSDSMRLRAHLAPDQSGAELNSATRRGLAAQLGSGSS